MINTKAYVRSLLMDSSITDLLPDKTVYFLHASEEHAEPYIEYEFYNENGEAWEEGQETGTNYYLQVDIFSKGNYSSIEAAVKKKLTDNDFRRDSAADLHENDTGLNHCAMRFIGTL